MWNKIKEFMIGLIYNRDYSKDMKIPVTDTKQRVCPIIKRTQLEDSIAARNTARNLDYDQGLTHMINVKRK